jgi:hypothetical protein
MMRAAQSSIGSKSAFEAPHSGHDQSAGKSSNAVPGAIPLSGSPSAGSYTWLQIMQRYFFFIDYVASGRAF